MVLNEQFLRERGYMPHRRHRRDWHDEGRGRKPVVSTSPVVWIGLIAALVSTGSTAVQWVFTYASMDGRITRVTEELARNFKEDAIHRERSIKAIERVDTNISALTQIHVKIGQLETQLAHISEFLKRMETRLDRDHDRALKRAK